MNASATIVPFSCTEFGELRTVSESGEVFFCAKDVADALGYSNQSDAIARHCKGVVKRYPLRTAGGAQEFRFISEPDVFRLIVSSKLPTAQRFEAWVFEEVLPSIRRTGGYMAAVADETPEETMARALLMADDTIKRQRAKLAAAEPKAALCDAVLLPSKDCCTVSEAARYLANIMPDVRRQDVFDKLRATGMMCKRGTAPTRAGIDTGRMVAVASEYRDPESGEVRAGHQRGKLTMKGVGFLTQALAGEVA
uniref:Bro-N domain-containing protein n=1 Tax=Muribaculaceae bacterium Z82 TaxID=2304548 RepID=A0A7C9N9R7_9BACT